MGDMQINGVDIEFIIIKNKWWQFWKKKLCYWQIRGIWGYDVQI